MSQEAKDEAPHTKSNISVVLIQYKEKGSTEAMWDSLRILYIALKKAMCNIESLKFSPCEKYYNTNYWKCLGNI